MNGATGKLTIDSFREAMRKIDEIKTRAQEPKEGPERFYQLFGAMGRMVVQYTTSDYTPETNDDGAQAFWMITKEHTPDGQNLFLVNTKAENTFRNLVISAGGEPVNIKRPPQEEQSTEETEAP